MRWFTREWRQGELSDATYEAAIADYQRNLAEIQDSLPSDLRLLTDGGGSISLHDGRFIGVRKEVGTSSTLLVDIACQDMQQGNLIGNTWDYPDLRVRLVYLKSELLEPSQERIASTLRDPRTEILHGEIEVVAGGVFEHRMLLLATRGRVVQCPVSRRRCRRRLLLKGSGDHRWPSAS
jgi:hypothetical protein